MKTIFSKFCLIFLGLPLFAVTSIAQEKFDIVSFKAPSGWQKSAESGAVQFTKQEGNGVGILMLFKSIPTGKDSRQTFDASWDAIVKGLFDKVDAPQMQPSGNENGWTIENGAAIVEKSGDKAVANLISATGGGKTVNLLIIYNSESFQPAVDAFIASIVLPKVEANSPPQTAPTNNSTLPVQTNTASQNPKQSGYKFNTSNFDDGWTATEQEDWVRVTKGNVVVLLHYPRAMELPTNNDDRLTRIGWDTFVAPRYSNLKNFKVVNGVELMNRTYTAFGNATENQTRKEVFVYLFNRDKVGWVEVITPSKNDFIQHFGFNPDQEISDYDYRRFAEFDKMPTYNKFAVAASDFTGTWTSDASVFSDLYFVGTGNYAGMNVNQIGEDFVFRGNSYDWSFSAVSGRVGNLKQTSDRSSGTFSVLNNWQVRFSNINNKPETRDAYFSCIKGGRLLHLTATSGHHDVFGKKK